MPLSEVTRHKPGKGKQFNVLGDLVSLKMSGAQNGEAVSVFEILVRPQGGPPPHSHLREDEAYYVLEGAFAFTVGETRTEAEAGTFIHFPRGVMHGYQNTSERDGRLLAIYWPAGIEHYFEEMDRLSKSDELESEQILAVSRQHSIVTPFVVEN
jgi:quercetin dioxygenase-like cupin family protein